MRNVRVTYTLTMAEVPEEIDNRLSKFKEKLQSLAKLVDSVSFQEDARASMEVIGSIHARLEDMGIILYDCETVGHGFLELQSKMANAHSPLPVEQEVEGD